MPRGDRVLPLLASRDNVVLKQILQNPHHAAFLAVIDVLTKSQRGGVIRLLLSFLDDPHVPWRPCRRLRGAAT